MDDVLKRTNTLNFHFHNFRTLVHENFIRNFLNTRISEDFVFKEKSVLSLGTIQKICLFSSICALNQSILLELRCTQATMNVIKEKILKYEVENASDIKKDKYLKEIFIKFKNDSFLFIENMWVKMIKVLDQISKKSDTLITNAVNGVYLMNIE